MGRGTEARRREVKAKAPIFKSQTPQNAGRNRPEKSEISLGAFAYEITSAPASAPLGVHQQEDRVFNNGREEHADVFLALVSAPSTWRIGPPWPARIA
jgi:hypothetical protein